MPDCELSLSQAAWNAFADKLKEVGEKITAPTGAQNERERAEGYRYLVRMISAGHELAMEADRNHPELRPWVTPMRKVRGDGPDTLYHEARLDEKLAYRLSVRRGDDIYFSATIYAYHEDRGARQVPRSPRRTPFQAKVAETHRPRSALATITSSATPTCSKIAPQVLNKSLNVLADASCNR